MIRKKKSIPLGQVYRFLEPGPVVLLTTEQKGRRNVMTMSWSVMIDFDPPLVGLIVSNRDYSFKALKETKECAINIPTAELIKAVVGCGNTTGRTVDKFKRFGLTPFDASQVSPPLIAECFANLECRVVDTTLVSKYGFFVVQVLKAWADPGVRSPETLHHAGLGVFRVAGRKIKSASKMR